MLESIIILCHEQGLRTTLSQIHLLVFALPFEPCVSADVQVGEFLRGRCGRFISKTVSINMCTW